MRRKIYYLKEADNSTYEQLMRNNPTFQKMSNLCDWYGYSLDIAFNRGTHSSPNFIVNIRHFGHSKYAANIKLQSEPGSSNASFIVRFGGFDYLTQKDCKEFLDELENAYELISELNKIDLNDLPCREDLPED